MAEKAAAKKDQPKNKKGKQNEKRKHQENGVKHMNEQAVHDSNHLSQKKKNKVNNKPVNTKPSSSKKKSGSFLNGFFKILFWSTIYVLLFLGFLYLVDYKNFVQIRNGAGLVLNKTVSLLPAEVVVKGRQAVEYLQPTAQFVAGKFNVVLNQTSTFVNTNPLIKDHWTNIREISSICSERLLDYVRTLYSKITGSVVDVKNKVFK